MKSKIIEWIDASKTIGKRSDFVQGGGGNTSVKISDTLMAIKSSGTFLADMSLDSGYTFVDHKELSIGIHPSLNEKTAEDLLLSNVKKISGFSKGRPSMETGFHAILDTYVIHTHSVYANIINCAENGAVLMEAAFKDTSISPVWVPYVAPGLQLTLAIKHIIKNAPKTKVFFLENHGIIVTSSSLEDTLNLHALTNKIVTNYLNLPAFKISCELTQISEDTFTADLELPTTDITSQVLFPDQTIYLSKDFNQNANQVIFLSLIHI